MDIVFALMIYAKANDELKFQGRYPYESQAICQSQGQQVVGAEFAHGTYFTCAPIARGSHRWFMIKAKDPAMVVVPAKPNLFNANPPEARPDVHKARRN